MRVAAITCLALLAAAPAAEARPLDDLPERGKSCVPGSKLRVGGDEAFRAVVAGASGVVVRAQPEAGARVTHRFGPRTPEGVSSVFHVRERVVNAGCKTVWYRVLIPAKPNGASGWIRPWQTRVGYTVKSRIEIDLKGRKLRLYRSGKLTRTLKVAIGASATPTPRGLYYVFERLHTTNHAGPYGPGALGLSAFSNVLTGWARGGPIAIHGTNQPWSVGQAMSNGCLRVYNAQMVRLMGEVPAGTPVRIT